jgi:WD40 repeat protein
MCGLGLCVCVAQVSCLTFSEGGSSICSTSHDGTFRVSSVEEQRVGGGEDMPHIIKASLRSKRHFSPSEIALSCCALTDHDTNQMAVMGSWDNHVYLYSISR